MQKREKSRSAVKRGLFISLEAHLSPDFFDKPEKNENANRVTPPRNYELNLPFLRAGILSLNTHKNRRNLAFHNLVLLLFWLEILS